MTCKLLLADDSSTIQRVIELTFSGGDVQVVAVSDGEQAIQRIPLDKPDIVLADIGIPKRNGYEVAAFVKRHPELSHVPVLLLAGPFEPVDEARARAAGSDGVLVKPLEPQQVIARVRELIEGSPSHGAARAGMPVARPSSMPEAGPNDGGASVAIEVRTPAVERPVAASPLSRPSISAPGTEPATSLDDYFDRLDAAFAERGRSPALPAQLPPPADARLDDGVADLTVPTIDGVLSGAPLRSQPGVAAPSPIALPPAEPPDAPSTIAASPRAPEATAPVPSASAADAIDLPLPAAQVAPDVRSADTTATPTAAVISDELIDGITRRVMERLAPDAARAVVADIVSDVAERLVRAEIDRIRKV